MLRDGLYDFKDIFLPFVLLNVNCMLLIIIIIIIMYA